MELSLWFNRTVLSVWHVVGKWSPVEFVLVLATAGLLACLVTLWATELIGRIRRGEVYRG